MVVQRDIPERGLRTDDVRGVRDKDLVFVQSVALGDGSEGSRWR
jgi:hypothetical protein